MHHEIYEDGQLNVDISNVRATEEEIEKLKEAIIRGIGPRNMPPVVTLKGEDKRGNFYRVNFAIRGPMRFDLETVGKWLHSAFLVGWRIEAQAGPKQ